ncbi:PTS fructose transporter subunit IIC [Marinilactibacillus kalidii]|uniref:PTS fructose transporter subunit IIC n=1 Tax=Marinilactibacillus kalidii TaxID=2820274 RepID=UPI001ABE94C0|nr:PTS fructose transporter subunit IIC [Marinilactibacillus kalidii]
MRKFQQALMTGVSYMLPFIVFAGMTIAVTQMYSQYIQTDSAAVNTLNGFAWVMIDMIPAIFAAYMAYAIGDKAAIAPGFIGGYIAAHPTVENTSASGFLGAILAGFIAGYVVLYFRKLPFPDFLESIKKTLFIPVLTGWLLYFIMAYPVAITVGALNDLIIASLINLSESPQYAFLLGAILSAMCAFDMGGPLNKIAITFVFALWNEPSGIGFVVNAAVFPGIMVPALSVGIASLIAKSKFSEAEIQMAPASILSGLVGITEAALPYAFQNPFRVIVPNMIGAAIGGAMMMAFGVSTTGVSGVFGLPMASNLPIFILAIVVGVICSVGLQILVRKPRNDETDKATSEEELDFDITM